MNRNILFPTIAVVLSPLFGVFLGFTVGDFSLLLTMDFESWMHNLPKLLLSNFGAAILGVGLGVGVLFTLLYGVPVFYVLRELKLHNIWMAGLFGMLPAMFGLASSWWQGDQPFEAYYVTSVFRSAMAGLFTACTFWLIAVTFPSGWQHPRTSG